MLRNLVTSLFEHEQIKTTLPKARDAARMADKIITLGKQGTLSARQRADAFLLKPTVIPKVFGAFAERYAERSGGYTRIHKFGRRPGDNAPHAILEMVDGPRDLRIELTSRAIGLELLRGALKNETATSLMKTGVEVTEDILEKERNLQPNERGRLRSLTRWNLQKVLKFRQPHAMTELSHKVSRYIDLLLAKPTAFNAIQTSSKMETSRDMPSAPHPRAGEASLQETRGAIALSRGAMLRTSKRR